MVQVVRFPMSYEKVGQTVDFPDDFGLVDIVGEGAETGGDCDYCSDLTSYFEDWARRDDGSGHTPGSDPENEIVITVRNRYNGDEPYDNCDIIPQTQADLEDHLATLRKFAYRFAHAIDYMQLGNESYQGAGEFYMPEFETNIGSLQQQDLIDAVAEVQMWILDQLEAARAASALAGRPLRFIGHGFPGAVLNVGYTGDPDPSCGTCLMSSADRSAYVVLETNKFNNRERMYFDLHVHYKTVEWAVGNGSSVKGVIDMPSDDTIDCPWNDYPAQTIVSLEWGPRGDATSEWWTNQQQTYPRPNGAEFGKYQYENDDEPPEYEDRPDRPWEDFIEEDDTNGDPGWESAQYGDIDGDGFRLGEILRRFRTMGFLAACYGPTHQGNGGNGYNIAALFANGVSSDVVTEPSSLYIEDIQRYTPLCGFYESAVYDGGSGDFIIPVTDFVPHPDALDETQTCPDCGN